MKTHGVRFLAVPLLMMSLLASSCATYGDLPSGLQPGVPVEPKPGVLPPGPVPFRPPPPPRLGINHVTITSPQGGQTWYTGYGAHVTWSCYTRASASVSLSEDFSCLADVGVWQGGNLVKALGSGVGGGRQGWFIPFDLAGAFEIRVNNVYTQFGNPQLKPALLPGVESSQAFNIAASTATVDTPKGILISGDPHGFVSIVTWSYAGYPPSLKIALLRSSTSTTTDTGAQTAGGAGVSGTGSASWLVNAPLLGQPELFRYRLIDVVGNVWSSSNEFMIYPYRDCTAFGGFLTQDAACKYNPTATAVFKANTAITLGANGYVTQGTLAVDQDVFYANGRSVKLKAGTFAYFTVGLSPAYLYSGILAGDQVLDFAPNKSATWKDSTQIRFLPGQGWVALGTLVSETLLPHDGAACCHSGSTCTMKFPKDMEIACHVTGCDYPLPLGSCGACSTPGVSPSGTCCCN